MFNQFSETRKTDNGARKVQFSNTIYFTPTTHRLYNIHLTMRFCVKRVNIIAHNFFFIFFCAKTDKRIL